MKVRYHIPSLLRWTVMEACKDAKVQQDESYLLASPDLRDLYTFIRPIAFHNSNLMSYTMLIETTPISSLKRVIIPIYCFTPC
jgi:hypothetical protein